MTEVKKTFGTFPENIIVLSTIIAFNEKGIAQVNDEHILDILSIIPGYEVAAPSKKKEEPQAVEPEAETPKTTSGLKRKTAPNSKAKG